MTSCVFFEFYANVDGKTDAVPSCRLLCKRCVTRNESLSRSPRLASVCGPPLLKSCFFDVSRRARPHILRLRHKNQATFASQHAAFRSPSPILCASLPCRLCHPRRITRNGAHHQHRAPSAITTLKKSPRSRNGRASYSPNTESAHTPSFLFRRTQLHLKPVDSASFTPSKASSCTVPPRPPSHLPPPPRKCAISIPLHPSLRSPCPKSARQLPAYFHIHADSQESAPAIRCAPTMRFERARKRPDPAKDARETASPSRSLSRGRAHPPPPSAGLP